MHASRQSSTANVWLRVIHRVLSPGKPVAHVGHGDKARAVVLIFAHDLDRAVDVGMRVRAARYVAVQPRADESSVNAIVRLRPSIVMVEVGREELDDPRVRSALELLPATLVVFGHDATALDDAAGRYRAIGVSTAAPPRRIRSLFRDANAPVVHGEYPSPE